MTSLWRACVMLVDEFETTIIPGIRNKSRSAELLQDARALRCEAYRLLGVAQGLAQAAGEHFEETDADSIIIGSGIQEATFELASSCSNVRAPQGRPPVARTTDIIVAMIAHQRFREGLSPSLAAAIRLAISRHEERHGAIPALSADAKERRIRALIVQHGSTWEADDRELSEMVH